MYHKQSITPLAGGGKNEANFYIDPKKRKMVCSVYPGQFNVSTAHGDFIIPAKPEGKPYAYIMVPPGFTRKDFGDGQFQNDMNIEPEVVALDVVRDREDRGVFIPAGEIATEEEVRAAVERRNRTWMNKDIPAADVQWARRPDPSRIDDNAKMAARILGLKKVWAGYSDVADTEPCPRCRERIAVGAEICRHCHSEPIVWEGKIPRYVKEPAAATAGGKR